MAPISAILILLPLAAFSFAPMPTFSRCSSSAILHAGVGDQGDVQFGGNTWKPDEGKMAVSKQPTNPLMPKQ